MPSRPAILDVPSPSTLSPAAAPANRAALSTDFVSSSAITKAVANTSPAPVGSTSRCGKAPMRPPASIIVHPRATDARRNGDNSGLVLPGL